MEEDEEEEDEDAEDNAPNRGQLVRYDAKQGGALKKRKPRKKKRKDSDEDDSDDSQPKRKTKTVEVEIPMDWSTLKHHVLVYMIEDLLEVSRKKIERWCE